MVSSDDVLRMHGDWLRRFETFKEFGLLRSLRSGDVRCSDQRLLTGTLASAVVRGVGEEDGDFLAGLPCLN